MSRPNETMVTFDLYKFSVENGADWLLTIGVDNWWPIRGNGRIMGISFRYEEDAIAFKLKYNL